jgi:RimJ/RimL family protein N-acetyltransferase
MRPITTRPLQVADLEHVQAIALAAWQWTYQAIFDPQFIEQFVQTNYAPDRIQQTLGADSLFEVALDGSHIIGFCQIGLIPQGARLFRIYLLPTYVGHGIGATLLANGEAWLQSKGIHAYGCYVHAANEVGKHFYERHGFQHQPDQDQDDEWYMHKTLSQ